MTYDPDNLFAKMVRGEIPCVKVYEDNNTLSFMDIFPQSRGHTLVIPKQADIDLLHTDDEVVAQTMCITKKIARAVDAAIKPEGIMIAQFNREAAGQTVFHLHFHIIPRYEGQALNRHGGGSPADTQELENLAEEIRKHLD